MKALIIGATGATGKDLLDALLQNTDYTEVVTFGRRPSGIVHSKLNEIITDFDNLEKLSAEINGDVWFSCLGTTLKAAGSKDKQRQIDFEIPARFAVLARQNKVHSAVLLSAYGASANSRVFYSRMKGTLEDKIKSLDFDQYIIFRPGLLLRENTDRFAERVSAKLLSFFNRIGLLKKFRPIPTSLLAEKLAKAPKTFADGNHSVDADKIFEF
jgi:uncharacterized protein YbjT (DUF2867 family)